MKRWRVLLFALVGLALVAAACEGEEAATTVVAVEGSLLDEVIARDSVKCGTRDALPGFAVLTPEGDHVGFDADFCRVIAAAVLGDANKVEFIDLETPDRFTALQSGQVDVLVRNTTWTSARDGLEGSTFLTVNYYDGQRMMVAADSPFQSVTEMDGVIVCVAAGTTTEGNAAAAAQFFGLAWEIRPFPDTDALQAAFEAGQCDGWSSDFSQLVGLRSAYPAGPDALRILEETFSKEPLAPVVLDGDSAWAQAVDWAVIATIQAEEFGITQANVDDVRANTTNPNIQKFFGEAVDADGNVTTFDPMLGIPTDFAYQVIKQVGNYGEIFARHLIPLGLERGVNAQWLDGGLMYAPPYR
ncbi:MAG: amino acid ABC transporter substrate-binding protein [Acidimicrobiia bacterium]